MTRATPLWLQQGSYAAAVDRRLIAANWPTPAVTGCAVTTSSGMTVNVAAGSVVVVAANGTGSLLCYSDAVEPVTLAAAPGAGSNRYDVVICQARGNDLDGGANNDFLFTTVTGTAAASPTVPATPNNATALANIYIPGGSASVTAGNITDVRSTANNVPAFPTTALRDALWPSPPNGALCIITANDRTYQRKAGLWTEQGPIGQIGYIERTTDTAAITAETSLAMDLTVTVGANRRIQLAAALTGANGTAGQQYWTSIKEGGTYIAQQRGVSGGPGWTNPFTPWRIITPTAGTHTYGVYVTGTGAGVWLGASPVTPMIFAITDLGPV